MPLAPDFYSAEMVRAMPADGNRYEVVHGELCVTPAPRRRHQDVAMRLVSLLLKYCGRNSAGQVYNVAADISWSDDTLVQPDVFVVAPGQDGIEWKDVRRLSLVAEVLSPSTSRFDRFQKRRLYQEQRVGTIWIIDADRRAVEVWTPRATQPVIETERLTWHPAGAPGPLLVDLATLFAQ